MSKKKTNQTDTEQESPEVTQPQESQAAQVKAAPSHEELLEQEKDRYLRLFAEFENYKKRTQYSQPYTMLETVEEAIAWIDAL